MSRPKRDRISLWNCRRARAYRIRAGRTRLKPLTRVSFPANISPTWKKTSPESGLLSTRLKRSRVSSSEIRRLRLTSPRYRPICNSTASLKPRRRGMVWEGSSDPRISVGRSRFRITSRRESATTAAIRPRPEGAFAATGRPDALGWDGSSSAFTRGRSFKRVKTSNLTYPMGRGNGPPQVKLRATRGNSPFRAGDQWEPPRKGEIARTYRNDSDGPYPRPIFRVVG